MASCLAGQYCWHQGPQLGKSANAFSALQSACRLPVLCMPVSEEEAGLHEFQLDLSVFPEFVVSSAMGVFYLVLVGDQEQ